MIDNRILTRDDRVELLPGVSIRKPKTKPRHRISVHATRQAFERLIPEGRYVDGREPITSQASEPEPDVAVIRGDTGEVYSDPRDGEERRRDVFEPHQQVPVLPDGESIGFRPVADPLP